MSNIDQNAGNIPPGSQLAGASAADWNRPRVASAATSSRSLFLAMLLISGGALLLYAEAFASLIAVWMNSSTFVHGFFVLPLSAILVWRRREALSAEAARPSPAGFFCLVLAVVLWLLSREAYVQAGQHLALIVIIVTGIWTVLGTKNARAIRFPLFFAFFSVPFGEFLISPLMDWTADFTVWALNATGIPVYQEAYRFFLPNGTFEVAEACSGIRYLIVAVALGTFVAHERFSSISRCILFVLGVAVGSIIANGVRAYLMVLIAHLSEMKLLTGQDHIYFGWFVFLALIVVIFWAGDRFGDAPKSACEPNRGDANGLPERAGERTTLLALAGALAIIALGPLAQQVGHSASLDHSTIVTLPRAAEPWSGPGPTTLAYRPSFTGEFETMHAGYSRNEDAVDVHEIFFAEQHQGSELVSQGNRIYDAPWRLMRRLETETISIRGGTMQVNSLVVTDGQQNILLWYWYDVSGRLTTSDVAAKLYHAIQGILGRNKGDAALVLATPAAMSGNSGDSARFEQFLDGHLATLGACLRSESRENANCTGRLWTSRSNDLM